MMRLVLFSVRTFAIICVVIGLASCATTEGDTQIESSPAANPAVLEPPASSPRLASLDVAKRPLGLVIRDLYEQADVDLVLMNGLENFPIDELKVYDTPVPDILREISGKTGFATHVTPYYTFMYDPAYESLVTIDLKRSLPESYRDVRVFAKFGSDTPLFTVFAMLSRQTGKTLVADNAVADALCGELNLQDVPLPEALEAVFQSARIPQNGIRFVATDDFIFVHSSGHSLRRNVASKEISAEGAKLLAEECSISLLVYTQADNKVRSQLGASKLYKVLSELSLQLGLAIRVDAEMNYFPVNPVVMNNVTRETALKLFVHQWLVSDFEFTIENETVVIRKVT